MSSLNCKWWRVFGARGGRQIRAAAAACDVARRWPLALAGALLTAALLWCAPALALSQRGHTFSFAYGSAGKGEGQFKEPTGVAVNDGTGDTYIADGKNKRVVQLEPLVENGAVIGEHWARSFEVPSPSQVAVDNSTETSDPSRSDVYVVGSAGRAIYKFSAEGVAVGEALKRFEVSEHGVTSKAKLEGIEGIAVDSDGRLFVYQKDGEIFAFSDEAANRGMYSISTGLEGAAGLALDSGDNFYAGIKGEASLSVVAELEGITGEVLIPQLDGEDTTAVAVNTADVLSNGVDEQNDVYIDNVSETSGEKQTTIAQFAPEAESEPGRLIERFRAPDLTEGAGIAVDDESGVVYVTDAASDELDVFDLEGPGPPTIEDLSAGAAVSPAPDARRLSAQINPTDSGTRYHFEYGTATCAATPSPCTSSTTEHLGGEAFAAKEVSVELPGLEPGTYHDRVVAENSFGTVDSAEGTFTILTVADGLPDGRAWEMVSPPNKHGAAIESLTREGGQILASEDGDSFAFVANGALDEEVQGNRSFEPQQALAIREAQGWRTQDIATPQNRGAGANFGAPEYQFFSPELSLALVEPYVAEPSLAPGVSGKTVYLRDDQPIAPGPAQQRSYAEAVSNSEFWAPGFLPLAGPSFLDATPDLANIVLDLSAGSSGAGLYEWSAGGGLRLVSELPGGGSPGANVALGYLHTRAGSISDDGSRVIWTASQTGTGHLYMRNLVTGTTVQLDAAQQGLTEPVGAARFQTASSDGSRTAFTDDEPLVEHASVEPARKISDLYECEMVEPGGGKPSCSLEDLTIPVNAGEEGAVQGAVLGASEDGSRVFLVAQGVLATNENPAGEAARSGEDNLYELHRDGSAWVRTFIAVLSPQDSPDWDEGANVSAENTAFQTARVSPNGEYLAFMSERSLTGYDNEDVSSKHPGERLDQEVYVYDTRTQGLTCVSCDPTGARPTGVLDQEHSGEGIGLLVDRREAWRGQWLAGNIPGWTSESATNALYQSRYLSNEGRLFFDSADPLVPGVAEEDRTRSENVTGEAQAVGVEKVYEYEPAGVGGCASSATGGCVALISSDTSSKESAFLEATPSGNDVFFLTAAQLAPQDTDDAFDIYDARVCTSGSPCLAEPAGSSASCASTEECHLASSPQQTVISISGSAAFSGPPNLSPPASKQENKGIKVASKPLTQAQKLTKALKACRKQHARSMRRRQACERHARELYRAKPKAKKK